MKEYTYLGISLLNVMFARKVSKMEAISYVINKLTPNHTNVVSARKDFHVWVI
jgi:hypothetical protein